MNLELILETLINITAALSAGIAVTCAALYLVDLSRRVEFATPGEYDGMDFTPESLHRIPIMIRICLPLAKHFAGFGCMPLFDGTRARTRDLIQQCGLDQQITPDQFMGSRIALFVMGLCFSVLLILSGNLMAVVVLLGVLWLYPMAWLRRATARRHMEIQRALPNFLDLLTLSVEAGKDFLTATREILRKRRIDALGEELGRAFHEIQLGKSRRDALRQLSERVRQPDFSAVLNAIVQADELGVSIGQVLRVQGDQLRSKRFQRAEKLANEAPVKILFPMVIFILPAVFIILAGPIILNILRTTGG